MCLAWLLCGYALVYKFYPAAITSGLVGISMAISVTSMQMRINDKPQNTDVQNERNTS
jgi:mannose/fructose/N-acetylgalactosamine-specific phosphotransferase system component IIC